ncbi:hypothetical protein M0R04_09785 [Candidatus Dojkabacteria bacterium]|jgi:hypothetical protein|nr:hypothetical protein [Candidatus Dojkabacteria bacterium]
MKKTYNPFRMWGSYIGGIIGLISIILVYVVGAVNNSYEGINKILVWGWLFPSTTSGGLCNVFTSICGGDVIGYAIASVFIGFPLQIIFGFLLGWGIHSIIRKFKK